jgi:probable rRNA maturation factor
VNGPALSANASGAKVNPPCEIQLQNPGRKGEVAARRLRPWLAAVVADLAPTAGSLGIRFISDQEMKRLNATWRQKDQATDVLSFPGELRGIPAHPQLAAGPPLEGYHLGDIAISVPTARRQAQRQNHATEREFKTLLLHGLLHCLGYDHETDDGTMRRLEGRLRAEWIDHD